MQTASLAFPHDLNLLIPLLDDEFDEVGAENDLEAQPVAAPVFQNDTTDWFD